MVRIIQVCHQKIRSRLMKRSFCVFIIPECPVCVLDFRLHLLKLVIVQRKTDTTKIIIHNFEEQIVIFMRTDCL